MSRANEPNEWNGTVRKMTLLTWMWQHPLLCVCCYMLLEFFLPVAFQPTAWILRGSIRIYQLTLSPALPTMCKFRPTCSQYGLEAIRKYGTIKGGLLTTWRILRCNPFNKGGEDPQI
jgi:putative membrane protein insertion efficiency factor